MINCHFSHNNFYERNSHERIGNKPGAHLQAKFRIRQRSRQQHNVSVNKPGISRRSLRTRRRILVLRHRSPADEKLRSFIALEIRAITSGGASFSRPAIVRKITAAASRLHGDGPRSVLGCINACKVRCPVCLAPQPSVTHAASIRYSNWVVSPTSARAAAYSQSVAMACCR